MYLSLSILGSRTSICVKDELCKSGGIIEAVLVKNDAKHGLAECIYYQSVCMNFCTKRQLLINP